MPKPNPAQPQPWDRQPGETERAYSAFKIWLDTDPPSDRSYIGAYRTLTGRLQALQPPAYFREWVIKYHWGARALQRDNYFAQIAQESVLKAIAAKAKKWAERQEQIAEDDYQDGAAGRKKFREMIAAPTFKQTITNEEIAPDGRTIIRHITLEPVGFTFAQAAQLFKIASERQRLAAEMATDIVQTVDSQTPEQKRLAEARRTLAESRERFPNLEESQRLEMVASAFDGVTVDDLSEPGEAVTSSELVQ